MKQYAQAVQHLSGIVAKGVKDYPGMFEILIFVMKNDSIYILTHIRIKCWYADGRY